MPPSGDSSTSLRFVSLAPAFEQRGVVQGLESVIECLLAGLDHLFYCSYREPFHEVAQP